MTVPFATRAAYQIKNYNAGIPQNPDSIFDALADPPESAVAAEAASLARSQAIGVVQPDPQALKGATSHTDWVRDFYDSASIAESPAPTVVAPTIAVVEIDAMVVDTEFSQQLTATGGAPITWTKKGGAGSGSLPVGITISENGLLSGTPTTAATGHFVVVATNSAGSDEVDFDFIVTEA